MVGGRGPPPSFSPPSFLPILFPVFNAETEIGFNSLIIRLVLVSHRPMIRVDERTQLCSTLRLTLPANLFSSFYRGTDWFLLPLSSEHNCLVFGKMCLTSSSVEAQVSCLIRDFIICLFIWRSFNGQGLVFNSLTRKSCKYLEPKR